MKKHGRIINRAACDVTTFDPAISFHPDIAKQFVELPSDVENGWFLDEKDNWKPPEIPDPALMPDLPAEPTRRRLQLTPSEFRNAFSAFEEVAIVDYSTVRPDGEDPKVTTLRKVVGVFFDRLKDQHLTTVDLGDPRNLAGLDLLVSVGILTAERRAAIAQGLPV